MKPRYSIVQIAIAHNYALRSAEQVPCTFKHCGGLTPKKKEPRDALRTCRSCMTIYYIHRLGMMLKANYQQRRAA